MYGTSAHHPHTTDPIYIRSPSPPRLTPPLPRPSPDPSPLHPITASIPAVAPAHPEPRYRRRSTVCMDANPILHAPHPNLHNPYICRISRYILPPPPYPIRPRMYVEQKNMYVNMYVNYKLHTSPPPSPNQTPPPRPNPPIHPRQRIPPHHNRQQQHHTHEPYAHPRDPKHRVPDIASPRQRREGLRLGLSSCRADGRPGWWSPGWWWREGF